MASPTRQLKFTPGPGSNEIDQHTMAKKVTKSLGKVGPGSATTPRMEGFGNYNPKKETPGPGNYSAETAHDIGKSGSKSSFKGREISGSYMYQAEKKGELPGPGKFNHDTVHDIGKNGQKSSMGGHLVHGSIHAVAFRSTPGAGAHSTATSNDLGRSGKAHAMHGHLTHGSTHAVQHRDTPGSGAYDTHDHKGVANKSGRASAFSARHEHGSYVHGHVINHTETQHVHRRLGSPAKARE